jgi:hypothetical protein
VLPAIICVLASITAVPASDAMITSTPNVHDWLFDTSGSGGVDTQSEAVTVAQRYDVVIAAQRYYPFLSAMKKAKPGIVVAPYHKGTSVYGSDFTMIKSKHPDWLLHTKSGALLKSSWGTYLIDSGNSGVRSWEADYAKQSQARGWTGVYLDSMGLYGFSGFTGTPIDPRTHSTYTTAQWIKDEEGLAAAVKSAISVPLIINGLRTGPGYFKDTSPLWSAASTAASSRAASATRMPGSRTTRRPTRGSPRSGRWRTCSRRAATRSAGRRHGRARRARRSRPGIPSRSRRSY